YFFCEEESSAKLACLIAKLSEEERQELINKLSGSEDS
ncbi:helix-turn-helix domain-containing protein, partial [Vibrio mediterranei]